MHGRLKIKTSAQEQEEKKKERERKLKAYRKAFEAAFEKRQLGEFDAEVLQITEQLLCGNPDIYTLWNIRREVLQVLRDSNLTETFEEDLKAELRVTEAALRSNPKSYGAWHHRIWVLENLQNPPVTQELFLCGKLLKADPRNFHCWDYRRWLTLDRDQGNKDRVELEFSLEKLKENFSNYSAWHYRTLFLPRVHADADAPCSITSAQHKKELNLVQNAVFTDPGDQSAWFYLRWLLGSSCYKPQLRMGVLQSINGLYSAALVLNVSQECDKQLQAELRIGKKTVKGKWKCSSTLKASYIWTFVFDEDEHDITLALEKAAEEGPSIAITESGEDVSELFLKKVSPDVDGIFEWLAIESKLDDGKTLLIAVLEEQLNLCTQLLELEPDSRWALLTAVQLLRILMIRQPESKIKKYDEIVMKYLDKLIAVDPLRCGYYNDLRSDCRLVSVLHPEKLRSSYINLSSLGLTSLPTPLASLPIALVAATEIDLTGNPVLTLPLIRTSVLAALAHLPRLRGLRMNASFPRLNNSSSLPNLLPYLPYLLHLELVPDIECEVTLSKEVVHFIYKIMPSLKSLKPL